MDPAQHDTRVRYVRPPQSFLPQPCPFPSLSQTRRMDVNTVQMRAPNGALGVPTFAVPPWRQPRGKS